MSQNQATVRKAIKKASRFTVAICTALTIYGCSSTDEDPEVEPPMTPEQQQAFILEKIESWSVAEPDIQRVLALESDMQLIIDQLAVLAELDENPLPEEKPENSDSNSVGDKTASNNSTANTTNNPDATAMTNSGSPTYSDSLSQNSNASSMASNQGLVINQEDYAQAAQANNNKGSQTQKNRSNSHKMAGNVRASSRSTSHYFPQVGIHIAMFKNVNQIPKGWMYLQSILPTNIANKKPLLASINYENTEYYSLRVGPFRSANSAKKACVNLQQQQHYCSVVEYRGLSFN